MRAGETETTDLRLDGMTRVRRHHHLTMVGVGTVSAAVLIFEIALNRVFAVT